MGWIASSVAVLTSLLAAGPLPASGASYEARDPDRADVVYAEIGDEELLLDVYLPPEPTSSPVPAVIFVHGGGFRRGHKGIMSKEASAATERGWVAISIDYRLGELPGHPAEMQDVQSAVEWVRDHAEELGVDARRVALFGDSAGGNLSALAAAAGTDPIGEGSRPWAVVSFSGPMDLPGVVTDSVGHDRAIYTVANYLGCALEECPDLWEQASPISHVSAGDPPMMIVHSEEEGLPVSGAKAMAAALEEAGVEAELLVLPGGLHARAIYRDSPEHLGSALDFLEQQFASDGTSGLTGGEAEGSEQPSGPILLLAVAVAALATAGTAVLVLRRRRRTAGGPQA